MGSRPAGCNDTASHTSTGSCFPLSRMGWRARNAIRPPASSVVRRPHNTSPGPAAFSRRAATLTVSPMTVMSPPAPIVVAITSPEFTPIEKTRSPPRCRMAKRGGKGALGIVVVRQGDAEDGHDRVAHVLVDRAAMVGDDLTQLAKRRVDEPGHDFGIGALRQRGETHHVGEQDRGQLPLLDGHGDGRRARGVVPSRPEPHWPQNRCPSVTAAPHDGHPATGSVAPQCPQNR